MNNIENIEDYFAKEDGTYGIFECPKCEIIWGPSEHADPPGDIDRKVKCTCGAILEVMGEWVSIYSIEAELVDE